MLSVVITTWNESANLPRVVRSVKSLADEIVVVDTESTDNTVSIAKKLGCKVFNHPNTGIVEPVRNFSISKASGDWILLLDADEEVSPSLAKFIRTSITSDTADYYRLARQNLIFGRHITSTHWWPDYVYRLFKKGYVVWSDAIHSVPITRGRGADFPPEVEQAIIHHHYQSISQYFLRIDRYTDYQLLLLEKSQVRFSWPLLITCPSQEFISQFFSRGGYKDGIHGLALSCLQGISELVLYLKLWQKSGFESQPINLRQLNSEVASQYKQYRWWSFEVLGRGAALFMRPVYKILRKIYSLFI